MSKCENCKKYDDCRDGSGLTWPCGAYRPIIGELLPEELQELAQAKAEGRLEEVVRCKECAHSRWPDSEGEPAYIECYNGVFNNNKPKRVKLTDYCSYGAREATTNNELKGGDIIATT